MKIPASRVFFLATCLSLFPNLAFAYIDPGSGAYLIQLAMATLAAGVFYMSQPIKWIKNLFRKLFRRDQES